VAASTPDHEETRDLSRRWRGRKSPMSATKARAFLVFRPGDRITVKALASRRG